MFMLLSLFFTGLSQASAISVRVDPDGVGEEETLIDDQDFDLKALAYPGEGVCNHKIGHLTPNYKIPCGAGEFHMTVTDHEGAKSQTCCNDPEAQSGPVNQREANCVGLKEDRKGVCADSSCEHPSFCTLLVKEKKTMYTCCTAS
mmetsp:Transcript_17211/g.30181  ORF Transcript_17211/g.30181 Transcript_17211/m.30181 type:complete len:145 (+) Transcript_17211:65-499(+)|eukprot:CAMPEP_0197656588 /NCGR_PEP_ID=MMETSP1338-20131121/42521_1 /TAXON_ID=43686 ORGANISM="Pelagodinium beii, Strain RCC1491" /NCGR_SAMPLE_ID=MMETSP1338 /ASSEMBLY_ACC=CAM_ASM_000754 /LENGTH=144 /DNA_ID=CAMNT_0043232663 /DNA_START=65 /DNA_END=499 /DNA_ORIENTATION=+